MSDTDDWVLQPYNGQDNQPCPYGCIMSKCGDKLKLEGDCRIPWADDCRIKQEQKQE